MIELNRKSASWRDPDPAHSVGQKLWDSPTMRAYPEHVPAVKRAVALAAAGDIFNEEVKMERDGTPTAYLDVSMQPEKLYSTLGMTFRSMEAICSELVRNRYDHVSLASPNAH